MSCILNISELTDLLQSCGVRNLDYFINQSNMYYSDLIEMNKQFNLTRIIDKEDFWIKHIIDSLFIYKVFPEIASGGLEVCDIGCGAGFPLIPLAIAFPDNNYTGFESREKKSNFVRKQAEKLKINCKCFPIRGIEASRKRSFTHKFDILTARAVAPLPKLYNESIRFMKQNGRMIFYKTPQKAIEEKKLLLDSPDTKGLSIKISDLLTLPYEYGDRVFVTIEF